MKKNYCTYPLMEEIHKRSKIMRIMKLTLILFLSTVFTLLAENTYSQNARITIHKENASLQEILEEIEEHTEYLFLYNKKNVNVNHSVTVNESDQSVSKVLDKILRNTNINYKLVGNHIVLSDQTRNLPESKQQNGRTITGTVVDNTGEPIIGANVIEKGTTNGVITDIDGRFLLNIQEKAILQVSYIGYLTQEIPIRNQSDMRITLIEDTKVLEEVVVIGYGTQKKADLTGSVANINTDKLNVQSNPNIGQALQGKIAGVDIVSQGGSPGAGSKIMVRGIGTLNESSPLFIVDGMYMNDINHINPNDMASIDVLKDASSAAIYGSRAANGVIIITTKTGSNTEGKPIIDLSASVGVQSPSKYLDLLNAAEWAHVTTVARQAIGKDPLDMASDLANKPDNDWQDIMLGPAMMQNYNLSLKGGGKTYTYYTGLGYMNQDGTVKGTNYERFTVQFKSDYRKGIFSAGNNIVLTASEDVPQPGESRGGLLGTILQSVPTLEKYDSDRSGGYGGTYGDVANLANPLGTADKSVWDRLDRRRSVYINLYAQLELLEGLKYKLNLTPDFQFTDYKDYQSAYDFGLKKNDVTILERNEKRWENILVENTLSFDRTFGDHKVAALVGYSYQSNKYRVMTGKGKGMPDGLQEIDAATIDRATGGESNRSVLTSILSRVFYSYKNRYLITATLRRDGSSKFAPHNRYGNFPSFSLGWNMAEEEFMARFEWLDQLKIRGGYGVLGNQEIGNYQYTSTVKTGINYPDGKGGIIQGAFPKVFSSPNIKWEETAMTNIGIDLVAINNKLSFTADYYIKKTKDILLKVPIPISSGGSNDPIRNAGEIENKGFEFNIGWNDRPSNDLSYGVNLVGSVVKNEVTKMGTGTQAMWSGVTNQNINVSKTLAGYPIGGFWLIPTDGYFQNEAEVTNYQKDGQLIQPAAKPGDIRFKDTNNDGKINDDDRVYSGSPFPDFTLSLNGNMRYKDFDFSIGLQSVFGNKIYNATRQTLEDVTKGTNFLRTTADYWTPENPNAKHPRLVWDDPNRNTRAESDRYLEKGDYLRLRNLQIGYTIPTTVFNNLIQRARVYVNAENLFTITGYSGYTPDVNASSSLSRGFDYHIYPVNRVFMLGIDVTF